MATSYNAQTLKIGLLGGTFDPIHKGHTEPAKQALKQFSLDKILVIPAHKPPHKNGTKASTEHRIKMTELACSIEPTFELDTRETNRSTLSYTVDTLKEIKAEYPTSELFFIMGMDSLLNFTTWHLWQEILLHCHLIVNTRPGYDLSTINNETKNLLAKYQHSTSYFHAISDNANLDNAQNNDLVNNAGKIFLYSSKDVDISSTKIRNNIANNVDCSQWLTQDIIDYIKSHQLYLLNK